MATTVTSERSTESEAPAVPARLGGIRPYARSVAPEGQTSYTRYAGQVTGTIAALLKAGARLPFSSRTTAAPSSATTAFLALPDDVHLRILAHLPVSDILNVGATCSHLLPLAYDPRLYRTLLYRMGFKLYAERPGFYARVSDWPLLRRTQQRRAARLAALAAAGTDALVDRLLAPPSLVLLLRHLFRWPAGGRADRALITTYGDPDVPPPSGPMMMADLALSYLDREPLVVFQAVYRQLRPSCFHPPTVDPDAANLASEVALALHLDQLRWFLRGDLLPAGIADATLRATTARTLAFESRHLRALALAYRSADLAAMRFHADVLQLVHDGRAGLQFWVQYHPLFAPGPDGLPGLHALRDPALTDLTSTTWPTFLDALAGHIRDFHDLVAVGLSDGRTTLTFVTAEVVTRLVVPALRALVARENRPTGAEHLALIADVFHRSLAWIDAAAALPRVALLPDYVRLALFTPCTDLIRTQLVAERQYVEGQYEARRVAHPTVGGDFSQFISLELALDMLHLNKAALARVAVFWIQAPAAWAPRDEILACAETLFVLLVRHLATHHLRPAFTAAIARLTAGAAAADPAVDLAQLDQFLALVHVADLIVQMVEVYHKQEMLAFVDEYDFLSAVNQEKRSFETGIDDQAAAGLDRVIDRLMDQVAHLLRTTQRPDAFTPPADRTTSVQPTPTCQQVLACLSCCTSAVTGATDKHVVDVFLGEVALRLFNVLSEHLKRFRVDPETGAVQLMADLNAYHGWATRTLRNPDAIRYFDVLKEVGNLYLVTPQHLRSLLLDGSRFEPVLRVEEAYEFVILRTDYARIKGMVEDRCAFM